MPNFAANLSMMFQELPFLERFEAAAEAGFKAVEFLFPYEYPAEDLRRRLDRFGLRQVLFNLPPGDWIKGDRGVAALPGREGDFCAAAAQALNYARALGCTQVHAMAGILPPDADRRACEATYVANLGAAGVPGRHEPDVGEINYPYLFDLIDGLGYDGWIGCEYRPRGATLEGLGWARPYGIVPAGPGTA